MTAGKQNKQTANIGAGRKGPGRPKGSVNKLSGDVKAMILKALDDAGGAEYLLDRAKDSPAAFMTLVGKVLPMQVTGADGGAIKTEQVIDLTRVSDEGLKALRAIAENAIVQK